MEQARLKEIFRYFRATSQAVSLTHEEIDLPGKYLSNEPVLSADIVLNALVQLVAHNLRADRAFISLIDNEFQFVIAEATKTVSLVDSTIHAQDDYICIGAKPLSLDAGICAGTMHAFTTDRLDSEPIIHTPNVYANSYRYVINDLTAEDSYKSRPYVAGYPHMRWYAEVPLRTSNGYAIGSLAVVDSTVRVGLSDDHYRIMCEVASAIMRHLEMVRISAEHSRAVNLLNGLDKFMHQSPLPASAPRPDLPSITSYDSATAIIQEQPITPPPASSKPVTTAPARSSATNPSLDQTHRPSHNAKTSGTLEPREMQPTKRNTLQDTPSARSSDLNRSVSSSTPTDSKADGQMPFVEPPRTHQQKRTAIFSSAASLLREAADLDGVIFFDVTPAELGHEERPPITTTSPISDSFMEVTAESEDRISISHDKLMPEQRSQRKNSPICKRLGGAFRKVNDDYANNGADAKHPVLVSVMRSLLQQFPKGTIFNFEHVRGLVAPADRSNKEPVIICPPLRRDVPEYEQPNPHKPWDFEDELRSSLPGSRSVIFQPLWNSQTENWYAACVAWSNDPRSILQSNDLSYITAFSNSVMAEVVHMELLDIDNAKSDFISSISHEIRSPLHGILGSAEILSEVIVDKEQRNLVQIVENCGRNLLETMDNILHYSKINSKARITQRPDVKQNDHGQPIRNNQTLTDVSIFDISQLVEQCTESLIVGHQNSVSRNIEVRQQGHTTKHQEDQELTSKAGGQVVVILRIAHLNSWIASSRSAVWQRILINLLGNAMKYTSVGYIDIELSASPTKNPPNSSTVTLVVRDTGKGISQSYLQHRLYQPFVQENTLSPGTGLGLSIVKGLLDEVQGDIAIQSTKGVGTEVRVSIPVTFAESSAPTRPILSGQTICLLGFDADRTLESIPTAEIPINVRRRLALKTNMILNCEKWLQMRVSHTNRQSAVKTNFIAIMEDEVHQFKRSPSAPGLQSLEVPEHSILILLCVDHTTKEMLRHHEHVPGVYYLSQPFGPLQLVDIMTQIQASMKDVWANKRPRLLQSPGNPSMIASDTKQASQMATTATNEESEENYVLLVEDNLVNLQLLVRSMQRMGRKFLTATDGQQALDMYRSRYQEIEHIFMDVSMPVMDGFTATREIRALERSGDHPRVPITMVTGLGSDLARKEAETCGCDRFLVKPVKLASLRSLLEEG